MGLLPKLPPHDPAMHDYKEPEGAGFGWWAREAAKVAGLAAVHGDLLNGNEAARFLGVSNTRVAELASNGTVRRFRAGRHSFYPLSDLKAYDARRKSPTSPNGRGHKSEPVYVEA